MMEIEKAIEIIKKMEQFECACPDCEKRRPALVLAISALEKQVPREPIKTSSSVICKCSICGKQLLSLNKPKFCHGCGQALKWEVSDNRH